MRRADGGFAIGLRRSVGCANCHCYSDRDGNSNCHAYQHSMFILDAYR
jgi:hypothetical protein